MNKYEIGTQWKTRGGWRAVVVDVLNIGFVAYHSMVLNNRSGTIQHDTDGKGYNDRVYDLIEPWPEPVVHEGWVMFKKYPVIDGEDIETAGFYTSNPIETKKDGDYVACIKVRFEEGEGL